VCDQENLENEEAKARYRAVEIHPQWVVTLGKQTNKQVVYVVTLLIHMWEIMDSCLG
jgi:hypothetical protein